MQAKFILFLALLFVGCKPGATVVSPPIPRIATPDIVYIEGNSSTVLNAWLNLNRNKRVISFTEIVDRSSGQSHAIGIHGFILQVETSGVVKQKFEYYEIQDFYADTVQKIKDKNEDWILIDFCAWPTYSGGAQGFLVLLEEREIKGTDPEGVE